MKTYKGDYENEQMEIVVTSNDKDAVIELESFEGEHGCLFNVFEIDKENNEIRTLF